MHSKYRPNSKYNFQKHEPSRVEMGRESESRAEAWLLAQGNARMIAKNYRAGRGEIDLIFEELGPKGIELVFIEVRSRDPEDPVGALGSVTGLKCWRIQSAARVFLSHYRGKARQVRFDVMAWDGVQWEWCKNAW